MNGKTHLHITAWALAIILLIVVLILRNSKNAKAAKIVHMILRLDYLLILYSGGELLAFSITNNVSNIGELMIKALAGLWAIIAIELIAVRTGKEKTTGAWIQLIIAIIITFVLGFWRLPLGV